MILGWRSVHSRNLCGKRPGSKSGAAKMRLLKLILLRRTAGAAKQFVPGLGNRLGYRLIPFFHLSGRLRRRLMSGSGIEDSRRIREC